jgi:UDP-arabinose 4-epimerase
VIQLVFSSTCATYGNPAKLPVTEETPTLPINPYGRAKLMAEQVIRDYMASDPSLKAIIFRYFNVYGSDPQALLGEYPQPALRQHSRISGACMDAALHDVDSLTIQGVSFAVVATTTTATTTIVHPPSPPRHAARLLLPRQGPVMGTSSDDMWGEIMF